MSNQFIKIPASKKSISSRSVIHGVGINDADYMVRITIDQKTHQCPLYRTWQHMLERCYSKKFKEKHPTYNDCYACDDWSLFSNFREWMTNQDWKEKELDKDLIVPGNKLYSPNTCLFVTKDINTLLLDRYNHKGSLPKGVFIDKRDGGLYVNISKYGTQIYIGRFRTSSEASSAYRKERMEYLLEVSSTQSDKRVADGLRRHADLLL